MMREPKSVLMIQTGGKHFESNPKFYFLLVQLSRKKLKLILFRHRWIGTCHITTHVQSCVRGPSEMNEGVHGLSNM